MGTCVLSFGDNRTGQHDPADALHSRNEPSSRTTHETSKHFLHHFMGAAPIIVYSGRVLCSGAQEMFCVNSILKI
jgi:hypothetical protein